MRKKLELILSDNAEIGYLKVLPSRTEKKNTVSRNIRLLDILPYEGNPDIYIDLSHDNKLLGIEIIFDE